ncbi:hypothetical protein [Paenibacillus alginolyticus]|uniref:hypothetical protein n=1 Tax=Paenibacillus alginolyticus TaxID=59839 RepID=UPI001FE464EA|nr:hypothetical protein [Paenibacillus frigoriresistens]
MTKETGTSVTFLPDLDIFSKSFELSMLEKQAEDFAILYPKLHIQVWSDLA